MAAIEITPDCLVVRMSLPDKILALHGNVAVPWSHVRGASVRPPEAYAWFHGFKLPGTNLPGVVTAGSFLTNDGWIFYDVHDPDETIVIDLSHETYQKLVVQVDNEPPEEAVNRICARLGAA